MMTTHLLPLSTFPHHDDGQRLCGGEAQMAIHPDTEISTVPDITTNTRLLWTAAAPPPNPTHYAGSAVAPRPGQQRVMMTRVTLDRVCLAASFPKVRPFWPGPLAGHHNHRPRWISHHCPPTRENSIELYLRTRYSTVSSDTPRFYFCLLSKRNTSA